MSIQQTREMLLAYAHVSLTHGDTTEFFSDTVTSRIMNTGEEAYGRIAVAKQIAALQARASDIKPKSALFGEGHAAVEIDFVTVNATTIPYTIIFDIDVGRISAIRFYFAGSVPL